MLRPIKKATFISSALRKIERIPTTLDDLYGLSNALTPHGKRYAVDGVWADAPVTDVLAAGRTILDTIPTREIPTLDAVGHYPSHANACWSTQSRLYFSPNAVWTDPADDLRNEQWAHTGPGRVRSDRRRNAVRRR